MLKNLVKANMVGNLAIHFVVYTRKQPCSDSYFCVFYFFFTARALFYLQLQREREREKEDQKVCAWARDSRRERQCKTRGKRKRACAPEHVHQSEYVQATMRKGLQKRDTTSRGKQKATSRGKQKATSKDKDKVWEGQKSLKGKDSSWKERK